MRGRNLRIIYPVSEGFDPRKARFHQIFQTCHALAKRGCEVDLILGQNEFDPLTDVLPYYSLEPLQNLHLHTAYMLRREGKQKIHISWNGIFHFTSFRFSEKIWVRFGSKRTFFYIYINMNLTL